MATRNPRAAAAPQPANRGAAVLAGKQKAAAAQAGSRNPLVDIGNLVIPEGINRPITRSFGAQLLKNALTNKNAVVPAQPAAPRAALKPAKKAAAKPAPRPEQATKAAAAPDQNRKPSEADAGSTSGSSCCRSVRNSRKKAVNTLTTVLTARSKFACGLTEKPKVVIEDIDKLDGDNQLAVVDYIEDIYKFYKAAENESRPTDYMGSQPEINANMRAVLTDWLIEVHYKFELMPETLYLIMYVVDRYLSLQLVPKAELQLVGVAAMLIAGKYEEIWAPEVGDLILIADNSYNRNQILGMEKAILNKMEWNLTVPTMYVFLTRFAKADGSSDKEMEHMVFYFAELALMEYSMVTLRPSLVAASAIYAARCTLKSTPLWTDTLKYHTGYDEPQMKKCAQILISSHAALPVGKFKAIYNKYAKEQFACVALSPPPAASCPF
ncbi:hypothetical protein QOZ80_5BG0416130 [Eleusine coracana subsp. coracana]|nr:hypothetical protein QOZ80_5BG0416130 [Eleusine coracana subsp. coracana]